MRLIKEAGSLAAYTASAQLVSLALFVFVGRIFSVEVVGQYQVFMSYGVIISIAIGLGFSVSLPNVADEIYQEFVAGIFFVVLVLGTAVYGVLGLIGVRGAEAVALYSMLLAFSQLFQMIGLRVKKFSFVGLLQVAVAVFFAAWVVGGVSMGAELDADFLMFGQVLSLFFVNFIGGFLFIRKFESKRFFSLSNLGALREARDNPVLVMPSQLLNALSYNLPVLLIERLFGSFWAASYGVVLRFCMAPLALLGESLSKVFHSEIANVYRGKGKLNRSRYRHFCSVLLGGGVVVFLFIYMFSPYFFEVVLGGQWSEAGVLAKIFAPLFAIMLVVSPLSSSFFVFSRHKELLLSQFVYVLISIFSFALGYMFESVWIAFHAFSALSVLRYLVLRIYIARMMREIL